MAEGQTSAAAEDNVVSGIVVDTQGDPLVGVTVQQKGTQQKTITNLEGRYQLRCTGQFPVTLVFSYIGMKSQSVVVRGSSAGTVTLHDDATVLTARHRSVVTLSARPIRSPQPT